MSKSQVLCLEPIFWCYKLGLEGFLFMSILQVLKLPTNTDSSLVITSTPPPSKNMQTNNIGKTSVTNYGSWSERYILNIHHHFRESHKGEWFTALQGRSQSSAQSETMCLTCPSLSRLQKLSRTTWPETHGLCAIMRPRDQANSAPQYLHSHLK